MNPHPFNVPLSEAEDIELAKEIELDAIEEEEQQDEPDEDEKPVNQAKAKAVDDWMKRQAAKRLPPLPA